MRSSFNVSANDVLLYYAKKQCGCILKLNYLKNSTICYHICGLENRVQCLSSAKAVGSDEVYTTAASKPIISQF